MMANEETSLDTLRQEIDRIDDAIHDLLMQRTEVVEKIGAAKGPSSGIFLRPAREAGILRRLVGRHHGRFPKPVLVRLWRELMGALTALQGPFSIAVYMPERGAGFLELARDQYGAYATCAAFRSAGQVVRAVADGQATVGIMPLPGAEGVEPWWASLMAESGNLPRVIARLPFAGPGVGRGDGQEALAIACLPHEATGNDRTLLAVETGPDVSRARLKDALAAAGLEPCVFVASHHANDSWLYLVEVATYVPADDRSIARLIEKRQPVVRAVSLGGYAVQFSPEDLAG